MNTLVEEHNFWNSPEIVKYFSKKPADPVIVDRLELLERQPGDRALDLGCGGGRHSELLARSGYEVTAVDLNPEMIAHTTERVNEAGYDVTTARMSVEALGLRDDAFSVVISTGVLHQAKSLEDYLKAFSEVSRVLKKGGLFTMNVFTNAVWDDTYVVPDENEPYTVRTAEGLYQTLLPKEELYRLAQEAGLELEEEVTEDIRQENTGPRAVLRAHFINQKV